MKPENLEDLLRYRVGQAHETLYEAEILLNASALRGAVNRAYDAMFYALLAVLADKQFGTSKHSSRATGTRRAGRWRWTWDRAGIE